MNIQITEVDGLNITAKITFDDLTTLTQKLSVQPYAETKIDPETQKPVTVFIDPSKDVFEHFYRYGKNYEKENAMIPEVPDLSDLVGQQKSFPA